MCSCGGGVHVLLTTAVVLSVSVAVARASSYMRGYGVKASELWPHFRNTCNLTCPYGYQTDVEGNFVCQCHDPCKNVLCFWKTQCVVELPKACTGAYCRPKATCKDASESRQPSSRPQHGVPQADDAATTSSEVSYPERCLLPVTGEAKKCRRARGRWYFDSAEGACKQFHGCRTRGNNFKRLAGCERTCLGRKTAPSQKQPRHVSNPPHAQSDDVSVRIQGGDVKGKVRLTIPSACLTPPIPVTSGCPKVRRRWYFDAASGKCRKFRSCPTAGNNFRKRRHCKNRCLRLGKTSRRKGKRGQPRWAKQ